MDEDRYDNTLWSRFSFNDRTTNIWTLNGNFSTDLVIGLTVAMNILLTQLHNYAYYIELTTADTNEVYLFSVQDIFESEPIKDYIKEIFIAEDALEDGRYPKYPPPGKFYAVVYQHSEKMSYSDSDDDDEDDDIDDYMKYYMVVQVSNIAEFMQGFISMCSAFTVPFDEYIQSLPYDSNGVEYNLPDYDLATYIQQTINDE